MPRHLSRWFVVRTVQRVARPLAEGLMNVRPIADSTNGINNWAITNPKSSLAAKGVVIACAVGVGIPVESVAAALTGGLVLPAELTLDAAVAIGGLAITSEMNAISRERLGITSGEIVPDDEAIAAPTRPPELERGRGQRLALTTGQTVSREAATPATIEPIMPKRQELQIPLVVQHGKRIRVLPVGTEIDCVSGAGSHTDNFGRERPESVFWVGRILAYPPDSGPNTEPEILDNHFWLTPLDVWDREHPVRLALSAELSLEPLQIRYQSMFGGDAK